MALTCAENLSGEDANILISWITEYSIYNEYLILNGFCRKQMNLLQVLNGVLFPSIAKFHSTLNRKKS